MVTLGDKLKSLFSSRTTWVNTGCLCSLLKYIVVIVIAVEAVAIVAVAVVLKTRTSVGTIMSEM